MCLCVGMSMSAGTTETRGMASLSIEVTGSWVLGTKYRSCARAAHAHQVQNSFRQGLDM